MQQWGYNPAMGYNGSGPSCGGGIGGEGRSGGVNNGADSMADLGFANMQAMMFPDHHQQQQQQQQQQQRQFYNQDYQRGVMRQNQLAMDTDDMMEPNDMTWLRFQQLQRQQQLQASALLNDRSGGGGMCFPISCCGTQQSGGSPFDGNMNPMDRLMRIMPQSLPSGDMQCGIGFDGFGSSDMCCGYGGDRNGSGYSGGGMLNMRMGNCCGGSNSYQHSGLLPDI